MKKIILALAAIALLSFTGDVFAGGSAKKGKKVFNKCKICHAVGKKAKKKTGPPLNKIIGVKAGSQEGFKYSKVMVALGEAGLVWDEDAIEHYVKKPKPWLKKKAAELKLDCSALNKCNGKMAFIGLKKKKDRENVVEYLEKFSK